MAGIRGQMKSPPAPDEFEVTVIGPSYGEAVLVHVGDQRWIIVDSTLRSGKSEPSSIEYLRSIGVVPEECVRLIVVTHWHDDHIRGISETVKICKQAGICIPSAFVQLEFRRFLAAHMDSIPSIHGTGVDELISVVTQMRDREINHLAIADKRLLNFRDVDSSHRLPVQVWSLSPSSFQVTESLGNWPTSFPK